MVRTAVARKLTANNNQALRHPNNIITRASSAMATLGVSTQTEMSRQSSTSGNLRTPPPPSSDALMVRNHVLITPPPPLPRSPPDTPPLLLLEGDSMFISRAGKSRTIYRLANCHNDLMLEESYDIERAQKRMSLLGPASILKGGLKSPLLSTEESDDNSYNLTNKLFSFDLQEINHGVQNGCGTGSMSWDSSIVMGLYFAVNPHELRGDVLELGSGVGLGGILSNVATNIMPQQNDCTTFDGALRSRAKKSVTLTDVSDDVLAMLQDNIVNAAAAQASYPSIAKDVDISIQKLDWFDFIEDQPKPTNHDKCCSTTQHCYDTIIASDCAYLTSQIAPLSTTISTLLKKRRQDQKDKDDDYDAIDAMLHMFAPYNRGVVHDLIDELQNKSDMHVEVSEVELAKYRMKKQQDDNNGNHNNSCYENKQFKFKQRHYWNEGLLDNDDRTAASCREFKFLHIRARHKTKMELLNEARRRKHEQQGDQMVDID